ncbi:MAG: RNA 2',3'-cyclic phosphodiesterase [Propionibacteriaceae bacterium]|nr:RNA 2',3'-cyclic phosphodiesterase [Propionibacteriaceae bacterium]
MRCFLAVSPPPAVVDDIARFLEPRHHVAGWAWTRPERFHLTLAFMAEYPQVRIDELTVALDEWGRDEAPLAMQIAGAGCFGPIDRAKVLHLAVPGAAGERLGQWSAQLRALVSRHGGRPDGTGFIPHLTVARSRRGEAAGRLLQALDTYASESFEIAEVVLIQSHLDQHRHEVLHRARLQGRA